MTIALVLALTYLLMGCKALPTHHSASSDNLSDAQKMFEAGEIHSAKKITQAFLEDNPGNSEGVQLMARILDEEISQYKEAFETTAPEEIDQDLQAQQIKTWLEQGRSLLEIGEVDEAALTVENIFQYEPQHAEASALMDKIKNQALVQGKRDIENYSEIIHTEVEVRVARYKTQAREWMEEEKWGAARLASEKVLMLQPDDEEAHQLLKEIKAQRHD